MHKMKAQHETHVWPRVYISEITKSTLIKFQNTAIQVLVLMLSHFDVKHKRN
jgi:hypothetical protein